MLADSKLIYKIILSFIICDIALGLSFIIPRALGFSGLQLLDLNWESSLPTWYSSIKFFIITQILACAAIILHMHYSRNAAFATIIVSSLFMLLSIDEIAMIHEKFGRHLDVFLFGAHDRTTLVFGYSGYWMLALGPLLALALATAIILARRSNLLSRQMIRIAVAGVVIFIGSATAIESARNFVTSPIAISLQVTAEEVGEMIGVSLILWATLEYLRQIFVRADLRIRSGTAAAPLAFSATLGHDSRRLPQFVRKHS